MLLLVCSGCGVAATLTSNCPAVCGRVLHDQGACTRLCFLLVWKPLFLPPWLLTCRACCCCVCRYVPYVGDSKRALDEYTSEIFLGGKNTIVLHNTCEDSLLAAPIVLDLIILAELITRIELKKDGEPAFHGFHPIAVLLSYLTKVSETGRRLRH